VKTKHLHALFRLAYLLHEEVPGQICTDKRLLTRGAVEASQARRVAAAHVPGLRAVPTGDQPAALRNVIAPIRHARQHNTIPGLMDTWQAAVHPEQVTHINLGPAAEGRRPRKKTRHDPAAVGQRVEIPCHGEDQAAAGAKAAGGGGDLARSERAAQLAGDPQAQLGLLPCMHNLVDTIKAERLCNAHTDAVSKQRHRAVQSQLQYLVQWMPTVEEQWSLDAHVQLGYAPETCTPITWRELEDGPDEAPEATKAERELLRELYRQLYDRVSCEKCGDAGGEETLCICTDDPGCGRMYHAACAGMPAIPEGDWLCPCCARGQGHRQLYLVHWQPRWEPAIGMPQEAIQRYQAWRGRANDARRHRPRAAARTNLQNQGVYGGPRIQASLSPATKGLLKITHRPVNPHTDVAGGAAEYRVRVRTVRARHPGSKGGPAVELEYAAACVYDPDGRCVGQIEPARLGALYAKPAGAQRQPQAV
jgi:hypothetical protein